MGQKNDLVIERLAKRLGKLSRRNTALAQWAMQAEAKATKAERLASEGGRRVKELTDEIDTMNQGRAALMAEASAELHKRIEKLTAEIDKLRPGADETIRAELDRYRRRLVEIADERDQALERLAELEAHDRRGSWPSVADIAASRQVQWTPGVEYVSPHLVGIWKCVEVHVHGTGTFWRMGGDPQRNVPHLVVHQDNEMCFTEGPF